MDWSEEEKRTLGTAFIKTMRGNWNEHATEVIDAGWYEGFCAIATTAVELVAARGGTMTARDAKELRTALVSGAEIPHARECLAAALDDLSAQGARVAVLETEGRRLQGLTEKAHRERDEARKSADELQRQRDSRGEAIEVLEKERDAERRLRLDAQAEIVMLRERLRGEEDGNRELVRRAQQAEAQRDALTKECARAGRVEAVLTEQRDRYCSETEKLEHQRLHMAAEIIRLREVNAALSAAGQVLSTVADRTGEPEEDAPNPALTDCPMTETCVVCGATPSETCNPRVRRHLRECGQTRDCALLRRYPCSATCTHDDAATPGHLERVKERSEALNNAATPDSHPESFPARADDDNTAAESDAYERGAEAMRAACKIAVREVLIREGLWTRNIRQSVDTAIEGAAP